jgi:hypothetical protein
MQQNKNTATNLEMNKLNWDKIVKKNWIFQKIFFFLVGGVVYLFHYV